MKQRPQRAQRLPSDTLSENDDIQDSAMFIASPSSSTSQRGVGTIVESFSAAVAAAPLATSSSSVTVRSTTPATTATTATAPEDDISSSEELGEDEDIKDSAHPFTKLLSPEEMNAPANGSSRDDGAVIQPTPMEEDDEDEDSDIRDSTRTGEVLGSVVEIGEGAARGVKPSRTIITPPSPPTPQSPYVVASSSAEASVGTGSSATASSSSANKKKGTKKKHRRQHHKDHNNKKQQQQHQPESSISTNQTANMVAVAGSPAGSVHGDDNGVFDEWSSGSGEDNDEEESSSYEEEGDDDSSSDDSEEDSDNDDDDSGEEFREDEEDSSIEESSGSEYEEDGEEEEDTTTDEGDDNDERKVVAGRHAGGGGRSNDDENDDVEDTTTHSTSAVGSVYSQSQVISPSSPPPIDVQETPRASNKSPKSNNKYQINRPRRQQSSADPESLQLDPSLDLVWNSSSSSDDEDDDDGEDAGNSDRKMLTKQQNQQKHAQQPEEGYMTPPSGSNVVASIDAPDVLPIVFDDSSSDDDDDDNIDESNKSASSIDSDLLQLVNEGKLDSSSLLLDIQMEKIESAQKEQEEAKREQQDQQQQQLQDQDNAIPPKPSKKDVNEQKQIKVGTNQVTEKEMEAQQQQQVRKPQHEVGSADDSGSDDENGGDLLDTLKRHNESFASIDSDLADVIRDTVLDGSSTLLDVQLQREDIAKQSSEQQQQQQQQQHEKLQSLQSQPRGPKVVPAEPAAKEEETTDSEGPSTAPVESQDLPLIGEDDDDEPNISMEQDDSSSDDDEKSIDIEQSVMESDRMEATVAKSKISSGAAGKQQRDLPELSPKQQGEKQVLEILLDKESDHDEAEQGHDSDNIMLGVWSFCAGDDENVYEPEESTDKTLTTKPPARKTSDAAAMAMKTSSDHSERTEKSSNVSPVSNQKPTKKLKVASPGKKTKKVKRKKKKDPSLPEATSEEAEAATTAATDNKEGTEEIKKKRHTKKKVAKKHTVEAGAVAPPAAAEAGGGGDVTPVQAKRKSEKKRVKKASKTEGDDDQNADGSKPAGLKKKKRKKKGGVPKKRGRRSDYEPKDEEKVSDEQGDGVAAKHSEAAHQNDSNASNKAGSGIMTPPDSPSKPLQDSDDVESPQPSGMLSGFLSSEKPKGHIRRSSDNSSVVEMLSPLLPVKKSISPATWGGDIHSTPKKVIKGLMDMFPERVGNSMSINLEDGKSPPQSPRPGMLKRAASVPNLARVHDGDGETILTFLKQLSTPPQSAPSKVKRVSRSGNSGSPGLTISKSFSSSEREKGIADLFPQPPLLSPSGKTKKSPKPPAKKGKPPRISKKKGTSKSGHNSSKDSPKPASGDDVRKTRK